MKVQITAKTEQGKKGLKKFKKEGSKGIVMKLSGLKIIEKTQEPYCLVCSSSIFKGRKGAVDINKVYDNISMFWLKGLTPKSDYMVKLL